MMPERYILALDQGTTSSRAILFDAGGNAVGTAQTEFTQHYPRPGWVEQDAVEIWETQRDVARQVLDKSGVRSEAVAAIGVGNQRETTVVWDRNTGQPVCPAIVWQCRRTASICDALKAAGWETRIRRKTGLVIDAYFSATKLKWILDNVPDARRRAVAGDLRFGTVDTWLIWNLTRGRVHATDVSNASRTMLFNIHSLQWDHDILEALDIPEVLLPRVESSSGCFGETDSAVFGGASIPIGGCAGDQQAALFGQACFDSGEAKNTYGTGCFLLMNTGSTPTISRHGLLTTVAWGLDGKIDYALEGSVFTAGAVVQWLRDEMRMIESAAQSEGYARQVDDTHGVYFVPAFTGLGAPYWDMDARGVLVGLTRGARREHVVRAALESMAYQTRDVLNAMQEDSGMPLSLLRVDGGASANGFLMQFQADLLDVPIVRPRIVETTARGAAFLAGLAVGFWRDQAQLRELTGDGEQFSPAMSVSRRHRLCQGWEAAVRQAVTAGS